MRWSTNFLVFAGFSLSMPTLAQDDPGAACTEAARLLTEKDIEGALAEARWCVEGIEQLKRQQTLAAFPDEVEGYTGGELDVQSAMGMSIITRSYQHDGKSIEVSLTGGGAAAAGFSALAQLGLNIGGDAGKKLRIQRRIAFDQSDGNSVKFMVQLRSKGILNFESSDVDRDALLAFMNAFPIITLDDALEEN